jgi:hypothetical protein
MHSHTRRALLAGWAILLLSLAGCNSIYHRTGREMSRQRDRLDDRIRESRTYASAAATVIGTQSPSTPLSRGQLETCSWDLSRSVASVHDVASRLDLRDDPVNDVIAALDKANEGLSGAVNMDSPKPRDPPPPLPQVQLSLRDAIARTDAYLADRARQTRGATP